MKQYFFNDIEDLAFKAFDKFKATLETLSSQPKIIIALSGGSSVEPLHKQIATRYSEIPLSIWHKIIFCFADERLVPLNSPDSNYKAACDSFLNVLFQAKVIKKTAVATVNYDSNCAHNDYTLNVGGKINIALLGVGPDAHTCSLFPEHSSIRKLSKTFIIINDSPKPPARRISMSRVMIENTDFVFVFFIGENKRQAYNKFIDNKVRIEEAPIKAAQQALNCFTFSDLQ